MIFKELIGTKYSVGEDGTIKQTKTGRILEQFIINKHPCVDLRINRKNIRYRVHSLVVMGFFPINNEKGRIIHFDKDNLNTHYTNLQWISYESISFYNVPEKNNYIILEVSNLTGELTSIYNGLQHVSIKTKLTENRILRHINTKSSKSISNNYYYLLKKLNVISVAPEYIVFKYYNKILVASYSYEVMQILINLLR